MRQQTCTGHAAKDRPTEGGHLHHAFAAATGFLQASDLDNLHLRRDQVQNLADIFAHHTLITTAIGATAAWFEFLTLARRAVGRPWGTARWTRDGLLGRFKGGSFRRAIRNRSVVSAEAISRFSSASSSCSISRSIFSEDGPKIHFISLAMRSRRSGSTGHAPATWPRYWRYPPATPRSAPSEALDHQGGLKPNSTCARRSQGRQNAHKNNGFQQEKSANTGWWRPPIRSAPVDPFPQHRHLRRGQTHRAVTTRGPR